MDYEFHFHKYADKVIENNPSYEEDFNELVSSIESIKDHDLIERFYYIKEVRKEIKSLSEPINRLLKERLELMEWLSEPPIFKDDSLNSSLAGRKSTTWRLDFAKNKFSVEVAFNHQEATSHNLIKPTLASELNHVQKAIQTDIGVIITATQSMKQLGGFDNAIGTFETFVSYLRPYSNLITCPLVIIGLKPPTTFYLDKREVVMLT
jgi:hypothetical protein